MPLRQALLALTLLLVAPASALAERCILREVGAKDDAKHKVFFTKFPKEDTSGGRFKTCKIVKSPAESSETFVITPFRQDATVIVHPSNWPGG